MAFWDRVREGIHWDRGRNDDRFGDRDRGGWSGRDRDYDRPYDRGYGTDHGRRGFSAYAEGDRDYNDIDSGRSRNFGYGGRDYNQQMNRDRWSSGRMRQGSYDDYGRDYRDFYRGRDFERGRNYDRGGDYGYRGSAGGADFDRGSYGYDFGTRYRGNYDRTAFDVDYDRDRWRNDWDEWDRNRNRW
jgi:hypothetical protein